MSTATPPLRRPRPSPPLDTERPARPVAVIVAALAVLALILTGCGSGPTGAPSDGTSSATASAAGAGFPRDVTVGDKTVRLAAKPSKIVVLGPSLTETVFGVGAGSQVVAVDSLSTYPSEAPTSDLDAFKPSAEAIAAKNPDLVLTTDDLNNVVSGLEALKIPVAVLSAPSDVDAALAQFTTVGQITGNEQGAEQLVAKSKATLADAVAQAPTGAKGTSYYWEVDPTYYSITSQTFAGSVLAQFGLVNIADKAPKAASGYPQLSAEFIIDADPDLIFLADGTCCQQSAETVRKRAGWDVTRAVKDADGVVVIDDDVASRWGPRFPEVATQVSKALQQTQS